MAAEVSLFDKASLILRSNLSQLLDRFEEPEKEIDIIIYDMRKQYAKLKKESEVPFGEEGRAKANTEKLERQMKEWEEMATNAARSGDNNDARKCFDNFQEAKKKYETQKAARDRIIKANDIVREQMSDILDEIQQMEMKAGEIKAMASAAKATNTASEMKSGMTTGKSRNMFERMEAKAAGELEAAQIMANLESSESKDEDEELRAKYGRGAGDSDFEAFLANVNKE